jgi:hypothetical protein
MREFIDEHVDELQKFPVDQVALLPVLKPSRNNIRVLVGKTLLRRGRNHNYSPRCQCYASENGDAID